MDIPSREHISAVYRLAMILPPIQLIASMLAGLGAYLVYGAINPLFLVGLALAIWGAYLARKFVDARSSKIKSASLFWNALSLALMCWAMIAGIYALHPGHTRGFEKGVLLMLFIIPTITIGLNSAISIILVLVSGPVEGAIPKIVMPSNDMPKSGDNPADLTP